MNEIDSFLAQFYVSGNAVKDGIVQNFFTTSLFSLLYVDILKNWLSYLPYTDIGPDKEIEEVIIRVDSMDGITTGPKQKYLIEEFSDFLGCGCVVRLGFS